MPGQRYTGFIFVEHCLPLSNRSPAKSLTVYVHLSARVAPFVETSALLPA
jgi:hypothetical protein